MKQLLIIICLALTFNQGISQDLPQEYKKFIGYWDVQGNDNMEIWHNGEFGGLAGMGVMLKDGNEEILEELELKYIDGTINYVAKVKNQNAGQAINFELTDSRNNVYVFQNPNHDFPKKIIYRFKNDNEIEVTVSDNANKSFKLNLIRQN